MASEHTDDAYPLTSPIPAVTTSSLPVIAQPKKLGIAILAIILISANLRTSITSVGPVVQQMQENLGWSATVASMVTSVPLIAFAFISPIAPRFIRSVGLEKALALAVVGLTIGIIVRTLPVLGFVWLGTAIIGTSVAILNVALPAFVKRDFPTKIGMITGMYSASQSAFAAIAAGIAVPLANASDLGWRLALGIWSIVGIASLFLLIPRAAKAPRQKIVATDAHAKLNPWIHPLAWQIAAFMGIQSLFFYVLVAWLTPIEAQFGISATASGFHQSLMNLGSLFGSIACSALIQKLKKHWIIGVGFSALTALSVLSIIWTPSIAWLGSFVLGFCTGNLFVLSLSLFGLRTRHFQNASALSGMGQSVGYIIAALGPIALGALHEVTGSLNTIIYGVVVLCVVEALLGIAVTRHRFIDE